jgi:hypothetical protein
MNATQEAAAPSQGMAVAIMGLMRTGSTLITDMLSQRGRGLILSEPNILGMWSPNTVERIHKLALNNGLDMAARGRRYRVSALDRGQFPKIQEAMVMLALHVLELLDADLLRLMRRLRRHDRPVVATYHASDDTGGIDREAPGWVNHLSRGELVEIFRQAGFETHARWAVGRPQSFFHLRPISLDGLEPSPSSRTD